ncbi:hypothetical protein B0I35DRAFT_476696 [Stachybotrys elegans]|uniref:Kinetochore protein mis14 n=1 Tax=Stachybotrys elegans TaxID=80388 RepID=A0A8K0T002_9HYPO|nr:hypothetical protein B0I35DRAFT_476696 [Stachybotrys elegans]
MDSESVVSQVQRRIELQSPEDLAYLVANVRRAATARLDEAFPQVDTPADDDDDLRNQIEVLVNEYIDKTFALAAPNLSINGLAVPPDLCGTTSGPIVSETVYEPFDARKRQRVADLIAQEERLLEEVAALKRSVPARAAADHADVLTASLKQDQEALAERLAAAAAASSGDESASGGVQALERQDRVEAEFRKAMGGLARLKRDMPTVVAKMERAKGAGEYVMTARR